VPGVAGADWEWDAAELRRHGHRVVDLLVEHLTTLPDRPVFRPYPRDLAEARLAAPLPEQGRPADELLDEIAVTVLSWPLGNGHPRWAGWVNGPPSPVAVLTDALATAMNPSVAGGNHAATYVRSRWCAGSASCSACPAGAACWSAAGRRRPCTRWPPPGTAPPAARSGTPGWTRPPHR